MNFCRSGMLVGSVFPLSQKGVRLRSLSVTTKCRLVTRILLTLILACTVVRLSCQAADYRFTVEVPTLQPQPNMDGDVDASWRKASRVPVNFDYTFLRTDASNQAYVAQDSTGLDFAFVVHQSALPTANNHTNGAGVLNDDHVGVMLWPQGPTGFSYAFYVNRLGARFQTSSENSAYAPQWKAAAREDAGGYTVTMHIPFQIMRGISAREWRVQLETTTISDSSVHVWEYVPGQSMSADRVFAGVLSNVRASSKSIAIRPKPRVQIYALGQQTSAGNGGSTSRIGADISLPVTPTSSLVATFHPDYSNVEVDQQTISPSAFPRQYAEIRPFFTQIGSFFNTVFTCVNCAQTLYTPAIPTFAQGYGYEGRQGPFSFAAFDAMQQSRADSAENVTYTVDNSRLHYSTMLQRVTVAMPGFADNVTSVSGGVANQHTHFSIGVNAASDSGTDITDPESAQWRDLSIGYGSKSTTAVLDYQSVGSQFQPADGYVQQNDTAGYFGLFQKTFEFSNRSRVQGISVEGALGRYHNHLGQTNDTLGIAQIRVDLRNQLSLTVSGQAQGIQTFDGRFLPFNQNSIALVYRGQSSTPSSLSYASGSYYDGRLESWSYLSTLPVARALNLMVEVDRNSYYSQTAPPLLSQAEQWLERASIDWQISRDASFDIGARRIIGRNFPNAYAPTDPSITNQNPIGTLNGFYPFDYVNASNVSVAFHFLAAKNEFYVVYGDPNNLTTNPSLFFKWIRYIGAEKGT
jgi:hypothetical protein